MEPHEHTNSVVTVRVKADTTQCDGPRPVYNNFWHVILRVKKVPRKRTPKQTRKRWSPLHSMDDVNTLSQVSTTRLPLSLPFPPTSSFIYVYRIYEARTVLPHSQSHILLGNHSNGRWRPLPKVKPTQNGRNCLNTRGRSCQFGRIQTQLKVISE